MPRYRSERLRIAAAAVHGDAWRALAARACEPNPFYEPAFLLAAVQNLKGQGAAEAFLIWDEAAEPKALVGFAPFSRPGLASGLGFGAASFYFNPYIASTAPLIDAADPTGIAAAILAAFSRAGASVVLCPKWPAGRETRAAFDKLAVRDGLARATVAEDLRPAIDKTAAASAVAYMSRYSGKRRRGLTQRRRQLDQLGKAVFETTVGDAEAFEAFLSLEAGGWKGEAGTALGARPDSAAFARALFEAGGKSIVTDVLRLDGVPIAVNLSLVSNGVAFAFKSAYDERYAIAGPGVLLDQHTLDEVCAGEHYGRVDSCATSSHRLMEYWLERESIAAVVLATSPEVPAWRVRAAVCGVRGLRGAKAVLKRLLRRE